MNKVYCYCCYSYWFSIALRPRKPYGSLGRKAQDSHLDFHTALELWSYHASRLCEVLAKWPKAERWLASQVYDVLRRRPLITAKRIILRKMGAENELSPLRLSDWCFLLPGGTITGCCGTNLIPAETITTWRKGCGDSFAKWAFDRSARLYSEWPWGWAWCDELLCKQAEPFCTYDAIRLHLSSSLFGL